MSGPSGAVAKQVPSGDGDATKLGLFENRQFQRQIPQIALDLLLDSIDECRHLLQDSRSPHSKVSPSLAQEYSKMLSARERKVLDQAVEEFRAELRSEQMRELDRINEQSQAREGEGSGLYPLAPETQTLTFTLAFGAIHARLFDKHFSKFSDSHSSYEYVVARLRLGSNNSKELLLGAALLPLIVSRTEEFLAALVRAGLTLFPRALGEPPSVPNDIIMKYQRNISSSDIYRWQIDQQVSNFMNQSPNEWRKLLERWTKIDIAGLGADWDMLNEMIQRRHVIIHNGGRVDMEYLDRVAPSLRRGLYLGASLTCSFAYIEPVLIELETWSMCLAFRWDKNFFKGGSFTGSHWIDRITRLERNGRWTQALAILDSYLFQPLHQNQYAVILARINRWFCLQELGRDNESVQREVRAWKLDDSAKPENIDYMEIGRWALLRDYQQLTSAIQRYTSGPYSHLSKRELREMPLIKRAMQESRQFHGVMLSSGASSKNLQGAAKKTWNRPRHR